jgi:hypothetical protein
MGVFMKSKHVDYNVDYVPRYEMSQLFRWKRFWLEIKRNSTLVTHVGDANITATIHLT